MQPLKLEKKNHVVSQSAIQVQKVVQHKPAFVQEHYLP